tara:strand:+ start:64 stop:930 length:867 start_codon:yes stop_codon:yes gene_type:complete
VGTFNSNSYILPVVGGNSGTWGGLINTALGVVDADFTSIDTRIDTLEAVTHVTAFTGLSDTPSSFTTSAYLRANSGGTALEFVNPSITELSDTPSSLGGANQILKMNSGATALEWASDETGSGVSGISNLVEDTTPQLGGGLDCQSNAITSAGSLNGISIPSSGGTLAKTADISNPSVYDSNSYSFTAGTTETKNHGLGAKPDLLQYYIVCTTGEHGYVVGDEIAMPETVSDASYGATLYIPNGSTSQVGIVYPFGGLFQINRKDTSIGAVVATTAGRWNVRIKAVKF